MRKLWWMGGAAVAVGSFFWTVHQPHSALGRYFAGYCVVMRPSHTDGANCPGVVANEGLPDGIPSEPTPVEDSGSVAVAPAVDAVEPPPIVISEDDGLATPVAPEAVDVALYKGRLASADVAGCPLMMPYCDDDAPQMPYAEDEQEDSAEPVVAAKPHEVEAQKGQSFPAAPRNEANPPVCQEDPHYHDHYPGCPATGACPYQGCYGPDRHHLLPAPAKPEHGKPKVESGEESEEPPLPTDEDPFQPEVHQSLKPRDLYETMPSADVDTMEYRRSDGNLGEFGPGPV